MAARRGKINRAVFKKQLKKGVLSNKKTKALVHKQALRSFESKKRKLIKDFDNHLVTREIQAGPRSVNTSNTLGGYGNLFSFIGFDRGYDPTSPVREMLRSQTKMLKTPKRVNSKGENIVYEFSVIYPTKEQLGSVAPMPWEPGSWLLKIEKGISGLGHYIYQSFLSGHSSRSGTGVQSSAKVNSGVMFKRVSYISLILKTFEASLRR